jgi:hypothetical protein
MNALRREREKLSAIMRRGGVYCANFECGVAGSIVGQTKKFTNPKVRRSVGLNPRATSFAEAAGDDSN